MVWGTMRSNGFQATAEAPPDHPTHPAPSLCPHLEVPPPLSLSVPALPETAETPSPLPLLTHHQPLPGVGPLQHRTAAHTGRQKQALVARGEETGRHSGLARLHGRQPGLTSRRGGKRKINVGGGPAEFMRDCRGRGALTRQGGPKEEGKGDNSQPGTPQERGVRFRVCTHMHQERNAPRHTGGP